jgi:NTE family protein
MSTPTRSRSPFRAIMAAALLLLAASGPLRAQDAGASGPPRKRIGVALGGGSARGLAHIGVLEWLEEHRVPVDAVAGTSIGGLVGGAYATGLTPREVRDLVAHIDWDLVFLADSPFRYKTFRRKEDRRTYPAMLEFGLKGGLTLPRALTPGQQVVLLLDRLALPYYDIGGFDDLPTPYRSVAVDIIHSEAVVLDRGDLAEAMRATMAIPGLFPPVRMGTRLLVDGGVLDNVPADVARQMRPDVVIAVDVTLDPSEEREDSLVSVVDRTIDAVMVAGARRSLASADVVIRPDMKGLSSVNWRSVDAWRDRGYRAAEARSADLLRYAVGPEAYAAYLDERRARRRISTPTPVALDVSGLSREDERSLRRQLSDAVGRPVEPDRLSEGLLRVTGTDRYEHLSYRVVAAPNGPRLQVAARPRSNGPPFLSLAVEMNNGDADDVDFTLAGRTTLYDAVGQGSEVRLDFLVGTRLGAGAELYRPLGRGPLFVAPRAFTSRETQTVFDGDTVVAEYRVGRAGGAIDVGLAAGRRSELRAGVEYTSVAGRVLVGSPQLPSVEGAERAARARFTFDGQDAPVVPSSGLYATLQGRRYFEAPVAASGSAHALPDSPQQFWQAEAQASVFVRARGHDRLFVRAGGGTSFGVVPFFNTFSLGGPLRMGAYANGQLRGAAYALANGGYLKDVGRLPAVLGGHVFLAGWLEGGSAFDHPADAIWHGDISAGVVADSAVGALFAGASVGFDGRYRLYIALGPLFR